MFILRTTFNSQSTKRLGYKFLSFRNILYFSLCEKCEALLRWVQNRQIQLATFPFLLVPQKPCHGVKNIDSILKYCYLDVKILFVKNVCVCLRVRERVSVYVCISWRTIIQKRIDRPSPNFTSIFEHFWFRTMLILVQIGEDLIKIFFVSMLDAFGTTYVENGTSDLYRILYIYICG